MESTWMARHSFLQVAGGHTPWWRACFSKSPQEIVPGCADTMKMIDFVNAHREREACCGLKAGAHPPTFPATLKKRQSGPVRSLPSSSNRFLHFLMPAIQLDNISRILGAVCTAPLLNVWPWTVQGRIQTISTSSRTLSGLCWSNGSRWAPRGASPWRSIAAGWCPPTPPSTRTFHRTSTTLRARALSQPPAHPTPPLSPIPCSSRWLGLLLAPSMQPAAPCCLHATIGCDTNRLRLSIILHS